LSHHHHHKDGYYYYYYYYYTLGYLIVPAGCDKMICRFKHVFGFVMHWEAISKGDGNLDERYATR